LQDRKSGGGGTFPGSPSKKTKEKFIATMYKKPMFGKKVRHTREVTGKKRKTPMGHRWKERKRTC